MGIFLSPRFFRTNSFSILPIAVPIFFSSLTDPGILGGLVRFFPLDVGFKKEEEIHGTILQIPVSLRVFPEEQFTHRYTLIPVQADIARAVSEDRDRHQTPPNGRYFFESGSEASAEGFPLFWQNHIIRELPVSQPSQKGIRDRDEQLHLSFHRGILEGTDDHVLGENGRFWKIRGEQLFREGFG
jgi:hypothetical protein